MNDILENLRNLSEQVESLIDKNEKLKMKLKAYEDKEKLEELSLYHYCVDEYEITEKGFIISDSYENVEKLIRKKYSGLLEKELQIEKIMNAVEIYKLLSNKQIQYLYDEFDLTSL